MKIYGKHLTTGETESLKTLINEAACSDGLVEVVDTIEAPPAGLSDTVVLILGTFATCSDPNLEAELVQAHRTAQRAVWVWPKDSAPTNLPTPAANYCYSYVSWDAEKLAAVVADDDVICFETATGDAVPPVNTERNVCVDEDEVEASRKTAKRKRG